MVELAYTDHMAEVTSLVHVQQCQQAVKASAACCLALLMQGGTQRQRYFSTLGPHSKGQNDAALKTAGKHLLYCVTNVCRLHLHLCGLKTYSVTSHSVSGVASQVCFCVSDRSVLGQMHRDSSHAHICVKTYQDKRNISECDMQLNGGSQVSQIRRLKTRAHQSHTVHSLHLPLLPSRLKSLQLLIRS